MKYLIIFRYRHGEDEVRLGLCEDGDGKYVFDNREEATEVIEIQHMHGYEDCNYQIIEVYDSVTEILNLKYLGDI